MDIQNEIWRDAVGYEGYYQGSTWGRVKSLERVDCRGHRVPERILKPGKDRKGYLQVRLYKNGKAKTCKVHRLVAEAFIPNPDNLPCVNHRDENPSNNRVENLEWCTYEYNAEYGTRNERISKTLTNGKKSKRVAQYTLSGELVKIWSSLNEIHRQTGWYIGNISKCCRGHRKYSHAHGFIWRYID